MTSRDLARRALRAAGVEESAENVDDLVSLLELDVPTTDPDEALEIALDHWPALIEPGAIFDTPSESGCVAVSDPDEDGAFDAYDSDRVVCSFDLVMVTDVRRPPRGPVRVPDLAPGEVYFAVCDRAGECLYATRSAEEADGVVGGAVHLSRVARVR